MSRHVDTGETDQTIVFWAFDSSGDAVEVTTSDAVSYRRDNNGREGTPVSLTLVARTVAGTHRDSAITYKGDGKHELDLPDAAVGTTGEVTLEVTKSGVASVYVEKLEVSAATGDATLAKQEETLDAIDAYFSQVLATVDGTADTIVGFPETLKIGNSYTTDGGNAIHVFIRDENDDPITSVGTHNFTDPDFSCDLIITNSGNAGRVRATVTYVDPGAAESYLKVEIPLSESSRAAAGAATMQCTLKWDGVAKTIATQTVTWVARI